MAENEVENYSRIFAISIGELIWNEISRENDAQFYNHQFFFVCTKRFRKKNNKKKMWQKLQQ